MERGHRARAGLRAISIAATALALLGARAANSLPAPRDTPGLSQGGGLSRHEVRRGAERLSELDTLTDCHVAPP
jgi:hypothetical protein